MFCSKNTDGYGLSATGISPISLHKNELGDFVHCFEMKDSTNLLGIIVYLSGY